MTTSNGGVKNAETAAASNFDLYAGDFSCDDDISFENLLQLDNDIDKPAPPPPPPSSTTLHQPGSVSPSAQICRQLPAAAAAAAINTAQPSAITGSASAVPPAADTVVYLLTTSALRPPPTSAAGAVYDAVARNDVRPLLRFQISKRPTTTAVVGYGVELGAPIMTVQGGSTPQQRAPGPLSVQTAPGCELASIGERIAALPAGCAPSADAQQQLQRRLALTTAFNGDLTSATGRSIAAAVVAGTSPGARSVKTTQPLSGGGAAVSAGGGSKSKSAAAADARQTVQEKNAYEYERVMDILRYYRELVVERKLPGACLPCKRRKSKPLVSADAVTSLTTRPASVHPTPSTTTVTGRTLAVAASQYIRPVAMSSWPGQTSTAGMCLPAATSAGKLSTSSSSTSTNGPPAAQTTTHAGDTSTMSSTDHGSSAGKTVPLVSDEPPSRPSSVELGTVQCYPVNDDVPDCSVDLIRTCSSAPGLCTDDSDSSPRSPTTVSDEKISSLEHRQRSASVWDRRRLHRTLRRSVDLRRFVGRISFLHRDPAVVSTSQTTADSGGEGQIKTESSDNNVVDVWVKSMLPVKDISTQTTDTVVTKWTKAHLAISGPYQSWT